MLKRFAILLAVIAAIAGAPLATQTASAQDMAAGSTDWTGFYAGVWGGYHSGMIDKTSCPGGACADDIPLTGWAVGLNAGYDMMYNEDWLVGGFVTLPLTKPNGHSDFGATYDINPNWAVATGVRIGRPMDNFLPYAFAGLAAANVTVKESPPSTTASSTATHFGGVLGAGLEFALVENFSIDARYTLGLLGSGTYTPSCVGVGCDSAYSEISHNVSVGLNYKFN